MTDEMLVRVFGKYPSFQRAKVVRDKRTNKTKGFGFVSFKDPQDFIKAMKEMNGEPSIYYYIILLWTQFVHVGQTFASVFHARVFYDFRRVLVRTMKSANVTYVRSK